MLWFYLSFRHSVILTSNLLGVEREGLDGEEQDQPAGGELEANHPPAVSPRHQHLQVSWISVLRVERPSLISLDVYCCDVLVCHCVSLSVSRLWSGMICVNTQYLQALVISSLFLGQIDKEWCAAAVELINKLFSTKVVWGITSLPEGSCSSLLVGWLLCSQLKSIQFPDRTISWWWWWKIKSY